MYRWRILTLITAAILTASLAAAATPGPNIVFIVADDLGWGDLSSYGQKVLKTPNIDRLAAEGMKFTSFYSGSTVCAPSRASLLTGKHMGHATVRGNSNPEIPLRPDDVTFAEVVKTAGYSTALYGKWGVGGPVTLGRPNLQGIDDFLGYLSQWHAHNYYPEHLWDNEWERFIGPNRSGQRGVYAPDMFNERTVKFLEEKGDRPFLLYLPSTFPHTNNELGVATGDGQEVPDYGEFADKDWPNPEKGQARFIQLLDETVGMVMAKLKEIGQDENTIIFFTSDNGSHSEGGHKAEFFDSSGPLRGIKRDLYEGGIRVPLLVRWPGKIKPGSVSDEPLAFWDILPTFGDLAGVPWPQDIDGISFKNELLGKPQQSHEYLYWEFHESGFDQAVRMGKWKAVRRSRDKAKMQLFDLSADIGEKNDIAAQYPEIIKKMDQVMRDARTDSKDFPVSDKPPEGQFR
jgi:arylsulfatase A-like enzyme